MNNISFSKILNQLKADLIGKDSFRGITLTYAWLANQFGHFALGFIPTILFFSLIKYYNIIEPYDIWAALICCWMWFFFELGNFLGPLLLRRKSVNKAVYIPSSKKYTFRPPWLNIAYDTFTDLCYFWIGAFIASEFIRHDVLKVYIILGLLFILFICFRHWYTIKLYLQNARYPFQFRLSQWDYDLTKENKILIKELKSRRDGFHLLISGDTYCGRTSLGVALASEYSMRCKSVMYVTAMKLLPYLFSSKSNPDESQKSIWNWQSASMMVIDDINPGSPVSDQIITPEIFKKYIDTSTECNELNRDLFQKKKMIWILGTGHNGEHFTNDWKNMLVSIGINSSQVYSIHLNNEQV